jgi:adenosylcobinamide-GDP ribazoletransferase
MRFVWDIGRLDFHLPLVGLPAALLAFLTLAGAAAAGFDSTPAALSCLAVQYLAFNLFHLDGLMDSADALLGHGDKEKRLAILKDSRIGVYAFFAGFVCLSFKTALIAGIARRMPGAEASLLALLFAYPVAGRAAGALVPALIPPARPEGLGAIAAGARIHRIAAGTTVALATIWATTAVAGIVAARFDSAVFWGRAALSLGLALIAAIVAAATIAWSYRSAVGGYTGDAQGAAVELGELAYLCLALFSS